jgi:hypothetical protein
MSTRVVVTSLAALATAAACGRSEMRPPGRWSAAANGSAPAPATATAPAPAFAPATAPAFAPATAPAFAPAPATAPAFAPVRCTRDETFPSPWRLPEASAAAEVQLRPGVREILVLGDSGRHGIAMAWSAAGGMRSLVLPLDDAASDDTEGMAWLSGQLYVLTSSGAVRQFVPDGAGGLRRTGGAYRIGPPPLSCRDLGAVNCGKNWEGLCLRGPTARARCAGYAASKKEGALYCVDRDAAGRLSIDPGRPPIVLSLARLPVEQGILSDCAFGAAGGPAEDVLLVTTNAFGGSVTYVVDETTGRASPLDVATTLSNEAIAVDRDGALYAFMDDNGETSMATRFTCSGWPR